MEALAKQGVVVNIKQHGILYVDTNPTVRRDLFEILCAGRYPYNQRKLLPLNEFFQVHKNRIFTIPENNRSIIFLETAGK